ncbi:beta-glucosidase [Alteromonas sediminis]|uniref:Beta-glucosidase n=1 Tax=Alteromonas sediminis TaxID=2259342 RepID=A0A3N5YQ64_9ALTE|nr:GH1 family beta-glucosidase [Alteromonas sediminis]RPJ68151.1 beta-glucosidase [Alteromonas sediminis]
MNLDLQLPSQSPLMSPSFIFGVATSSFQIEGSADQRLASIWDAFCETPGKVADNSNGLVACEHVKRFREDVKLLVELGVDAYRFSISWPRVITKNNELNESGIAFYEALIAALSAEGISAFVTLYHWDLPQHLEDKGGWLNRQTVYEYEKYVDKVTARLGDTVASYATFNEPYCSAYLGYEIGVHAPGKTGRLNGRTAAHHILLAHGLGLKAIRKHAKKAKAGIVLNFTPCYPKTNGLSDIQAANNADDYINQWYIKPLFDGCYPSVIDELAEEYRPPIEQGDFDIMQQPLDFLGVNFYTRLTYSAAKDPSELYVEHPHLSPKTDIGWEIYPKALTELLKTLHERYPLPPVFITENGAAMNDKMVNGKVQDSDRIEYFQAHLQALHEAAESGVDIQGYFAWSLMDNFEWAEGYLKRFGLIYVDYATQKRTFKASAHAYKRLIAKRNLASEA